jgi:hypothetical protein
MLNILIYSGLAVIGIIIEQVNYFYRKSIGIKRTGQFELTY